MDKQESASLPLPAHHEMNPHEGAPKELKEFFKLLKSESDVAESQIIDLDRGVGQDVESHYIPDENILKGFNSWPSDHVSKDSTQFELKKTAYHFKNIPGLLFYFISGRALKWCTVCEGKPD